MYGRKKKKKIFFLILDGVIEKNMNVQNEIDLLTKWIDQGAKWGTHWAYIPPKNEKTPELNESTFSEDFFNNSIDKFIAVKMFSKFCFLLFVSYIE